MSFIHIFNWLKFGGILPDTHPEYNFGHSPHATQSPTHTRTILWQLDPRSLGADQLITSVPTRDLGSSLIHINPYALT